MSWWTNIDSHITAPFNGLPEDQDDWVCAQWKTYYEMLLPQGKERALRIVEEDVGNAGFFASVNNCKYDCEWVNYFKAQGLVAGNLISNLYCGANEVVDVTNDVVQTVGGVADAAGNVAETASFLTNKWILIAGAGIAFYLWQNGYFKNK